MKTPRIGRADVAARAGVSKTTVSYVLGGRTDAGIPAETRERVFRAARELGYRPNRAAQALRTGQTGLVAVWMSVLGPAYYAGIVSHVQELLRDSGYEMMVSDTAPHPDWAAHLNRLAQWPVEGILAFDSSFYVRQYAERFGLQDTPVVAMGVEISPDTDCVALDLEPGAVDAMAHLVAHGRRRVAYVGDPFGVAGPDPRLAAYLAAVNGAGLSPEVITVPKRSRRSAYDAMRAYIAERGCPEAIFAFNDDLAIGVQRAILDAGLRLPQDVVLVGHDGTEDSEYVEPRLSTVELPTREMCERAWELLRARIEDPTRDRVLVRLPSRLRVRASSGGDPGPLLS